MNPNGFSRSKLARHALALAAATVAWGTTASGQTTPEVIWDGGSVVDDKYVTLENWNPDTVPTNGANEFLQINDGSTALVQTGDVAQGAFLMLGMRPGDSGHLNISGGTMTLGEMRVGGRETINSNLADWSLGTFQTNGGGTGTVTQTGGDVSITYTPGSEPPIQSLYVGDSSLPSGNTANGTYTISGGTLTSGIANDDAIVIGTGPGAQGAFVQSGTSVVTSTGFLTVGRGGATATYNMTGGTLNVGTGTASSNQNLRVGDGEYPTTNIIGANGSFTQSGGTVTVKNDTTIGRNTGVGSYTMTNAGTILHGNNNINIGHNGTGTFTMGTTGAGTGPTINVGITAGTHGMSVGLGTTSPASGTFTLKSGTINIGDAANDYLAVGDGSMSTGVFNMEGGAIVTTDLVQLGRNNSPNDNRFNLMGGSITAGRMVIGGGSGATNGRGTFTMTGGTFTGSLATNIGFGDVDNTCIGVLDIQAGIYSLTGTSGTNAVLAVGNGVGGNGTLLLSGGTLNANTSVSVVDVGRGNATGTFTLSGTGVLNSNHLRMVDGTAGTKNVTFNNGTSTITTLTLGNVGVMTINGGSHTITTGVFSTGSTFNLNNISQTIASANFGTFAMNIGTGATLSLNAASTASAARTITKNGLGTLNITGPQTHFANSTLVENGGVVNMNSNAGSGLNLTTNGGVMNFGSPQTVRAMTVAGGTMEIGAFNSGTTGAITLTSGAINGTTGVLSAGTGFDVRSGSASAILGGTAALIKTTAGTVDLTGGDATTNFSNTYTGGTNVSDGTLIVNRLHGLAADATGTPNPVSITGGTLQVRESSPTIASGHPGGNNAFVSRPGSMITIANNGGDIVSLNPGTLSPRVYNGTLDLTNNDLVIDYDGPSPIADVEDMIRAGRNGGNWLGNGITSSTAGSIAAAGAYTLGVIDNATSGITPFTTFSGQTVDTTTVLVKFVHRSDINMDGVVTFSDSVRFNGNYSEGTPTRWVFGDLNYNGVSDFGDSVLFNGGYDEALSSLPEPGGVAVLSVAAAGLLARRRRLK